jgi:hypothetical protein
MRKTLAITLAAISAAACQTLPPTDTSPAQIPSQLRPSDGETFALVVKATGVQIYECRAKKENADVHEWAFVAPEAQLFDSHGRTLGRHYAGPHWEALDGSKVVGAVRARADAPASGTIPWLLLSTRPAGPAGSFSKVSSIQRINTSGGSAPAQPCERVKTGVVARVPYTADYRFYVARGTAP